MHCMHFCTFKLPINIRSPVIKKKKEKKKKNGYPIFTFFILKNNTTAWPLIRH